MQRGCQPSSTQHPGLCKIRQKGRVCPLTVSNPADGKGPICTSLCVWLNWLSSDWENHQSTKTRLSLAVLLQPSRYPVRTSRTRSPRQPNRREELLAGRSQVHWCLGCRPLCRSPDGVLRPKGQLAYRRTRGPNTWLGASRFFPCMQSRLASRMPGKRCDRCRVKSLSLPGSPRHSRDWPYNHRLDELSPSGLFQSVSKCWQGRCCYRVPQEAFLQLSHCCISDPFVYVRVSRALHVLKKDVLGTVTDALQGLCGHVCRLVSWFELKGKGKFPCQIKAIANIFD